MKTAKHLFYLSILSLLLFSCKKEEEPIPRTIHVKVKVLDRTGKPVHNVKIFIGSNPYGTAEEFEKSAINAYYTDSSGLFSFDYIDYQPYKNVWETSEDKYGNDAEYYNFLYKEKMYLVKDGYFKREITLPDKIGDYTYDSTFVLRKQSVIKFSITTNSIADGLKLSSPVQYLTNPFGQNVSWGCRAENSRNIDISFITEADTNLQVKWMNLPGGGCSGKEFEDTIHTNLSNTDTLIYRIDY